MLMMLKFILMLDWEECFRPLLKVWDRMGKDAYRHHECGNLKQFFNLFKAKHKFCCFLKAGAVKKHFETLPSYI